MCSLPLLSSHECQRKQRLSNLPIIILCFTFPILAQVLFFLFQSTACSDKAEVRVQTSPISKPANILGGFSTICIICVFNYMVILCIYSVVSSLKRGIESQRLDVTLFEKKSCILAVWTDLTISTFSLMDLPVSIESDSILVD